MAASDDMSAEDREFLARCEEELKDRFTDKDEEFMRVFNAEPCTPPIIQPWWVPQGGRRNDRRHNRRHNPYDRHGNRDHDRRDDRRGYSDYNNRDHGHGHRNQRPRYY